MGDNILLILNNEELSNEEKTILLKELANELKNQEEKKEEYDSSYDKYNDSQKKVVKKAREAAEENRARVEQINYNSSLKEKMEVLAFLKTKMGDNQYSKSYLLSLRGSELDAIYNDCLAYMPEAMGNAKKERDNAKINGVKIFEDYNLNKKDAKEQTVTEEPKIQEADSKLDGLANKLSNDEMDYILKISKIAEQNNISLKEAEALYLKDNGEKEETKVEETNEEVKDFSDLDGIKEAEPVEDQVPYVPNDNPQLKDTLVMTGEELDKSLAQNEPARTVAQKKYDGPMPELSADRISEVQEGGSFPNNRINEVIPPSVDTFTVKEERKKVNKIVNAAKAFKDILGKAGKKALEVIERFKPAEVNMPSEAELTNQFKNANLNEKGVLQNAMPINNNMTQGVNRG